MTEQSNQMARAAASSRVDLLKSTLATQRATGSAAASGRRGKSAEGVIRTAETLASIDQGAIVDSWNVLMRALRMLSMVLLLSIKLTDVLLIENGKT